MIATMRSRLEMLGLVEDAMRFEGDVAEIQEIDAWREGSDHGDESFSARDPYEPTQKVRPLPRLS